MLTTATSNMFVTSLWLVANDVGSRPWSAGEQARSGRASGLSTWRKSSAPASSPSKKATGPQGSGGLFFSAERTARRSEMSTISVPAFTKKLREVVADEPKAFAYDLGLSLSAVYNYLNGRVPATEVLFRIARYTGRPMEWFLVDENAATEMRPGNGG
jgi:transcriptional regulator with XRE-family HTH domain